MQASHEQDAGDPGIEVATEVPATAVGRIVCIQQARTGEHDMDQLLGKQVVRLLGRAGL